MSSELSDGVNSNSNLFWPNVIYFFKSLPADILREFFSRMEKTLQVQINQSHQKKSFILFVEECLKKV